MIGGHVLSFLLSLGVFLQDGRGDLAVDLSAELSELYWLDGWQISCYEQHHSGEGPVSLHDKRR